MRIFHGTSDTGFLFSGLLVALTCALAAPPAIAAAIAYDDGAAGAPAREVARAAQLEDHKTRPGVSAPVIPKINGACGSANGAKTSTAPTANLCSTGKASAIKKTKTAFNWSCAGTNGGVRAACSAPIGTSSTPINGACGSANGTTVSTAPTTNLCTTGSTSSVSGTGPFTWSCAGSNSGTTATCSANKTVVTPPSPVNGVCGSANGTTVSTAPTTNLCTTGSTSSVSGTGPFTWSCAGSNSGTTATCSANKTVVTPPTPTPDPVAGNCGLQLGGQVIFCETFDNKNSGIPSRTGELDPNVWGVSRATGVAFNPNSSNPAAPTRLVGCD